MAHKVNDFATHSYLLGPAIREVPQGALIYMEAYCFIILGLRLILATLDLLNDGAKAAGKSPCVIKGNPGSSGFI